MARGFQNESELRKRMRRDENGDGEAVQETGESTANLQKTWPVETLPATWWITECLYELSNPKAVYEVVVKTRFSAAFLNPAMLTGNPLDLQIAAKKAVSKSARNTMITKSLPMELLYALSPRTGISDSLKTLGFNPKLNVVLVVWIHSTPDPPVDEREAFEKVALQHGKQISLNELTNLRKLTVLADFYDFPSVPDLSPLSAEWIGVLSSYVTSKIATKE